MIEAGGNSAEGLLAIGDVAEATGLSVDTIRVWERRYGRPRPVRLPSGHRRYPDRQVRWLRRVAEALALGHRPSDVVALPEKELDDLLAGAADRAPAPWLERTLRLVREYRGPELLASFHDDLSRLGARGFVLERSAPLLVATGRAWADGDLDVRHEHFLSGLLEDVLRRARPDGAGPTGGPLVLLATLPGERHDLGIQMAAVIAVVAGARAGILGTETPVPEIVSAAEETGAALVGIGVSLFTGGPATDRDLVALRKALPAGVGLVAGGAGARGARRGIRAITYADDFPAFERLLARL